MHALDMDLYLTITAAVSFYLCWNINMSMSIPWSQIHIVALLCLKWFIQSVLSPIFEQWLSTDDLQYSNQKYSGCGHVLFTFKESVKCFAHKGSNVLCMALYASNASDKVLNYGMLVILLTL